MASIGLTKTQGANSGDPLTVAWKQAVQAQLQSDEDRLEALREVHQATVAGIAAALRIPVLISLVCLIACAAAGLALAAFKVAEVFHAP